MCQPPVAAEAVRKLFNLAKPGGWIQLVEVDLTRFTKGPEYAGFESLIAFMEKSYPMAKLNPSPARYLKEWLTEAGATEVQEEHFEYPLGASESDTEWAVKGELTIISMIDMYEQVAGSRCPSGLFPHLLDLPI